MSKIDLHRVLRFIMSALWYLFVMYVIVQSMVIIWASFYIDEIRNGLLFSFVGFILGGMIGYIKGREDTVVEKGLFDE